MIDRDLHTIYYDIQFIMIDGESIARLKQALQTHHRALEELESAVLALAFEEAADGRVLDRPESREVELLSVPQVCEHLGMCKSWVYRRIHNQEIPSVRLGRSIKIKRSDLEQYLEEHRNTPLPEGHRL
jgi:excisionase family DNA binding protein